MQTETMTSELYWLTLTVLMTALMWVPYIINRLQEQGAGFALWDPQGETKTRVPWAERMIRAHVNAYENLVVFAPLVLTLHITNLNNPLTAIACMVYFYARLVHYLVFSFGIPAIRIPVFAIGFAAQITLALTLLGFI